MLNVSVFHGCIQAVYGMFGPAAQQSSTPCNAQMQSLLRHGQLGCSQQDAGRHKAAKQPHGQLQALRLVLVKLRDGPGQSHPERSKQAVEHVVVVDVPGPWVGSLESQHSQRNYCRGAALVWRPDPSKDPSKVCLLKDVTFCGAFFKGPSLLPLFFEGHDCSKRLTIGATPGSCDPRRQVRCLLVRRQAVQLAAPDAALPNLEQSAKAAQAALDNVGIISALLATVAIGTYFVVTLQLQYEDSELGSFLRDGLVTAFLVLNAVALFSSLAAIIVVGMTPLLVALRKAQLNAIQTKLAAQPEHYFRYVPKLTAWRRCVFECMRSSLAWSLCFLLVSIFCFAAAATLLGFNQLAANQVAMWLFPAAALFFLLVLLVWVWHSCAHLQFDPPDGMGLGLGTLRLRPSARTFASAAPRKIPNTPHADFPEGRLI
jgi:hypothetical protein